MAKRLWSVLPIIVTALALGLAFQRFDLLQLWTTAAQLPLAALASVLLALLVGNLLACVRLKLIADGFHQALPFRDALVACVSGNLAGSFFFQVIGQTIARSAVLSKVGISVPTTIVITGCERVIAAAISFALAIGGTLFLFRHITFDLAGGGINLLTILGGMAAVTLSGAIFAWGSKARAFLRVATETEISRVYLRAAAVTMLIQATTMAAYVTAATSLSASTSLVSLIAASTLVMFAASVPISLAGWGLREVSAVYALGAIGVPFQVSLVVALLIGFSSIAVMAFIVLVTSRLIRLERIAIQENTVETTVSAANHASFLNWFISLFAASAVFFQIYIPVGAGNLNVNLADSVILFGGALFAMRALARGARPLPSRVPSLGLMTMLMSGVIALAFFHGLYLFGWTSWAFTNRFFGWLVILGYAGTGALVATETRENGLELLLRTFVASGLAIAAFELLLLVAVSLGVSISQAVLPVRIEGFAQNPNAFGFQLLLVISAIIALRLDRHQQRLALALTFAALFFTASRAAEGTAIILCFAAIALRYVRARSLVESLSYATLGVAIIFLCSFASAPLLQLLSDWTVGAGGSHLSSGATPAHLSSGIASVFSNNLHQLTTGGNPQVDSADRWGSIWGGVRMFVAHPIFGAGLGAFVEKFEREHGRFLIIHSTPVWLLAETGIIGFLAFALPYFTILNSTIRSSLAGESDSGGILLVLCLVCVGVMSQVHELLYQRTLWLLIGAALFSVPQVDAYACQLSDSLETPNLNDASPRRS